MSDPTTTTQGLYGVTKETLAIPPRYANLGSDMYANAYLLGYQAHGVQHKKNLAAKQRNDPTLKQERKNLARAQGARTPNAQYIKKCNETIKERSAEIEQGIAEPQLPKPALKPGEAAPGADEVVEEWKEAYRRAYLAGWEASALNYWKGASETLG
jgi:hypothetical protein